MCNVSAVVYARKKPIRIPTGSGYHEIFPGFTIVAFLVPVGGDHHRGDVVAGVGLGSAVDAGLSSPCRRGLDFTHRRGVEQLGSSLGS